MALNKQDSLCFGRQELIENVLELAEERRCVLLFGGRQAGKTTVLRHTQMESMSRIRRSGGYGESSAAVYVDLMALPYDAGPPEFYAYLVERAASVCAEISGDGGLKNGRVAMALPGGVGTVEAFLDALGGLIRERGNPVRRVIFLLDEAVRVLGRRFPRAFQDNVFSMLYVNSSDTAQRVALVLSGAQELAGFCEDETSPLGSRAGQLDVVNLDANSFGDFVRERVPVADVEIADWLFLESGGHAGVGAALIRRCATHGVSGDDDFRDVVGKVAAESRRLFGHWMSRFSEDARIVLEGIERRSDGLRRREVAALLAEGGRDRFAAEPTWHELQYVGVCRLDGVGRLVKCNELFWGYYREFAPDDTLATSEEREVWAAIRDTEIALRELVEKKYEQKWPGREQKMMKKVLGSDAWRTVETVKAKAVYRLSPGHVRALMDCMYLGQLGALIVNNQAWDLFKALFKDKRELQRWLGEIALVRNDIAHFVRDVPPKELQRCRIACDDVLVIVRRAVDEG